MQLYLIRHAQSANNALLDARTREADPPLTDLGRRQAEFLARCLAEETDTPDRLQPTYVYGQRQPWQANGYGITRLYCSPMLRSLQTASPVADALGLKPEVWISVHEVGGIYIEDENGVVGYGGQTRAQISGAFPNYVLPLEIGENGWWTGGCEEFAARDQRALQVATELYRWAATDERIAIISHGGFMHRLLRTLCNLPSGRMLYFHNYNTGISLIEFRPEGHLAVQYLNNVAHLPGDMLT